MIDQIQNRADTIKELLRQNPERGADMLIDFARRFGGNLVKKVIEEDKDGNESEKEISIEDEILLRKLDLLESSDDAERAQITQYFLYAVEEILAKYDPEAVKELSQKETAIKAMSEKAAIKNDLVLVADNISKRFPDSNFTLKVEHLEMRLGEITGLVGENATGKTTLFRILSGWLAPDSGEVRYPLFDPLNKHHWPTIKENISYVSQHIPYWEGSLNNIKFEAAWHGIKGAENQKETNYIIQRLGLYPHLNKKWAELSGGYKLRFALAMALVWKAKLLIIDEPLAFLDIKTQLIVLNDLKNLSKSLQNPISIIISSQQLHEIEAVADQILFMRDGELENLGRTVDFGKDRLQNVFEVGSPLDYQEFLRRISGFNYLKVWSNGLNFFIATSLDVKGEDLLQAFQRLQIPIGYYRDLSFSIKTKFYAENL